MSERVFVPCGFGKLRPLHGLVAAALAVWPVTPGASAQEKPSIVVRSVKPPVNRSSSFVEVYGLTRDDLYWLKQLPGLQRVVPLRAQQADAWVRENSREVRLVGTVAEYAKAHGIEVTRGRFIATKDEDARQNVAVISQAVARDLMGRGNPLGRHVRVSGDFFTVVGVIDGGGGAAAGDVFIPLSTMHAMLGDFDVRMTPGATERNQFELSQIEIWPEDRDSAGRLAAAVRRILRKSHDTDDYSITTE